jgi:signal transduction histidine kinase
MIPHARPKACDTVTIVGRAHLLGALRRRSRRARELAEEQAALRRVAARVVDGASPAEVFEAVCSEAGRMIRADGAGLGRYESDGTVSTVGGWRRSGGLIPVGTRSPPGEGTLAELILQTRRPGQLRSHAAESGCFAAAARQVGWRSAVGAPIVVDGHLWGVVAVGTTSERPLPPDAEARLAEFTGLIATAIADADSRQELNRLAEEQAALRRVATLVAGGVPAAKLFEGVIGEAGRVVSADVVGLSRYEADGALTVIGGWRESTGYAPIGRRLPLEATPLSRLVFETRRPSRVDSYAGVGGPAADFVREQGLRSSVGVPVIVEGRPWGVVAAHSTSDQPLPPETEERLAEFTDLIAAAIANADSRAELAASRARIVATADATRRRIERDLHDGTQQRLVSLALELRAAQAAVPAELSEHRAELSRTVDGLTSVLDELHEIARGIHPAILAEGGLGPALQTLARRTAIPVKLDMRTEARLPERVEVAAYYVVSEALTNAAKHARAAGADVLVEVRDGTLSVSVRDDGLGGADPTCGSGLIGLKDRAEAIGGEFSLDSPPGAGTALHVELPLDDPTR